MDHRQIPIWANILTRTEDNEETIMKEINDDITISLSCTIYTEMWYHPFFPIKWDLMIAS